MATLLDTTRFFNALAAPYIVRGFDATCGEASDNWQFELRLCPPKGSKRGFVEKYWFPFLTGAEDAAAFVHSPATIGKDVYVGVLPRWDSDSGTSENIAAMGALVASIDRNDDVMGAPADLIRLANLLTTPGRPTERIPKPQIVVHSGGGLHVVWQLQEPILFADGDPHRRDQGTSTLKRLARTIGSAPTTQGNFRPAAAEKNVYLSYLIRVPGSFNHKPSYIEQDGRPRPVRLLRLDADDLWNPDYPAKTLTWWRSHLPPDPAPIRPKYPTRPLSSYRGEGGQFSNRREPLRGEILLASSAPPNTRHDTAVRGAAMLSSAGVPPDEIHARIEQFALINNWNATDAEIAKIARHYPKKDGHNYNYNTR